MADPHRASLTGARRGTRYDEDMASRWGRGFVVVSFLLLALRETHAVGAPPAVPEPDPDACSVDVSQSDMTLVFDTGKLPGGPYYVNDHTFVRGPRGEWHLFGIFNHEPFQATEEVELVHAVSFQPDPARWGEPDGMFELAPSPHMIALRADASIGETHLWAPHVVRGDDRWYLVYQGGGPDDYHASIRLAESDDLYRWTRVGTTPLFEDICAARDPMLMRDGGQWALYYTRCESVGRKISGVAYRTSRDLVQWSEPRMALTIGSSSETSNSAYSESPFVFERNGLHFLSITAYPTSWDATLVYRSRNPFAFADAPVTRLRAHAAEWVFGRNDAIYLTHAGAGQGGVWMSTIEGL